MACLLGMDLPEHVRALVGEEWWLENQKTLRLKSNLTEVTNECDIELF